MEENHTKNHYRTEAKIELAKSWIKLSEILIILAGFMFASGGVIYSNSVETLGQAINTLEPTQNICQNKSLSEIGCETYANMTTELLELTTSQTEVWRAMMWVGGFLTILSMLYFGWGQYSLRKLTKGKIY